eukprot:jgi/Chlat1/5969/Chrsp4S06181
MAVSGMRGLTQFISDIRNCQSKEAERARVDKELANIRTKFKADRGITPYERKKYVWKMLYIYMLGYDVYFGHMEALSLISSPKYAEKQVGYIVTACLLNEGNEFLRLVINTVRNDIVGRNETFQCLALTMVANIGGAEFAEALAPEVMRLLMSASARPIVRKKAALCLLRLHRRNPEILTPDTWADNMETLLEEKHVGVLTASMSLLTALVGHSPEGYEHCLRRIVRVLERMVKGIEVPQDYTYYGIPSPWLQVKTMRCLQYFDPPDDSEVKRALLDVLGRILNNTDNVKNANKNNAMHAILFEAVNLVTHLDYDSELTAQSISLLGKFLLVREPNIRYLGLESMTHLVLIPEFVDRIKTVQDQVINLLKDPDISIRKRALDLLYNMCDYDNAKAIVGELLTYLDDAEYGIREELVLKMAILAERFAPDLSWYVDVMLGLTEKAGDFVSDEIWYRVVQIVTNNDDLQEYAAAKVLAALVGGSAHESMVKVAAYILGEFGHLLEGQPGCGHYDVFMALHEKFAAVTRPTKALLLTAYIKLLMHNTRDAQFREEVITVFRRYESFADQEIQQRAVEYEAIGKRPQMSGILAEMPKFGQRESTLHKKVEASDQDTADVSLVARLRNQSFRGAIVPSTATAEPITNGPVKSEPRAIEAPVADILGFSDASVSHAPLPPKPPTANGAPKSSNPMDLLGELMVGAPALPAPSPAPATPAASPMDPFGAVAPMPSGGTIQPTGSVVQWYQKLCTTDSGILYEDPFLQIGLKAEYRQHMGRLLLFFGNKSAATLENIRCGVPPMPALRAQLGPVPPSIPPQQQVQVSVDVACSQPFVEQPVFQLAYSTQGQSATQTLRLPVVVSKFLSPTQLQPQMFFDRWKNLAGPPLKLQELVRGARPFDVPSLEQLFTKLNLGVSRGLDPNPANIVAASVLRTERGAENLCMVRLETDPTNPTQFRLTVGTSDQYSTKSLLDTILDQMLPGGLQARSQEPPKALTANPFA